MIQKLATLFFLSLTLLAAIEKVHIAPDKFMFHGSDKTYAFTEDFQTVKAFWVQKHELSVGDYMRYLDSLGDKKKLKAFLELGFESDDPVTMVDFSEAQKVCRYYKGRLPTQREWMVAASIKSAPSLCYESLVSGSFTPWASPIVRQASDILVSCHERYDEEFDLQESLTQMMAVDDALENINGTFGMLGNVWEWVDAKVYYFKKPYRVIKGGSFTNAANKELYDSRYENFLQEDEKRPNVGFRCVWDEVSVNKESSSD